MYRPFLHDVTSSAMLVSQINKPAATLVFQASPLGVETFSLSKSFLLFQFICKAADHVSENAL